MKPAGWMLLALLCVLAALTWVDDAAAEAGPDGDFRRSVTIEVPPYRGLEPNLALSYSSRSGDGWLGAGWTLSGTSRIARSGPGKGSPTYSGADQIHLDGMELVPCALTAVATPSCLHPVPPYRGYATRTESYLRIAYDDQGGRWFTWAKTGVRRTYMPGHVVGGVAMTWELTEVADPLGNRVTYRYSADTGPGRGERHLAEIAYNGVTIRFIRSGRADPYTYATGRDLTYVRSRLRTIDVLVGGQRARAYRLTYTSTPHTGRSFLAEVQQFGRDAVVEADGDVASGTALPPLTFEPRGGPAGARRFRADHGSTGQWGPPWPPTTSLHRNFNTDTSVPWYEKRNWRQWMPADVDGDGRNDFVSVYLERDPTTPPGGNLWWVAFRTSITQRDGAAGGAYRHVEYSTNQFPTGGPTGWLWTHDPGLDFMRVVPGDVNHDGRSDLMVVMQGTGPSAPVFVRTAISNGDGTYQTTAPPAVYPFHWDSRHRWMAGDADGDGRTDLMVAERHQACHPSPNCSCSPGSNHEHAALRIAFSNGDGSYRFAAQETCWSFQRWDDAHWFTGDANGDGLTDFLRAVAHAQHTQQGQPHAALQTALSVGDGTFRLRADDTAVPWTTYVHPLPYVDQPIGSDLVQSGDFNADGMTDLVLLRAVPLSSNTQLSRVKLLSAFSRGDGTFRLEDHDTLASLGGNGLLAQHLNFWLSKRLQSAHFPNRWFTGDMDGDGATDLVIASPRTWDMSQWGATGTNVNLRVLRSNRYGAWHAGPLIQKNWFHDCVDRELTVNGALCPSDLMSSLFAGDVDADGKDDVMYAGRNVTAAGNNRVSLRAELSERTGKDASRFMPADIDGDGRAEMVRGAGSDAGVGITTAIRLANSPHYVTDRDTLMPSPALINPSVNGWRTADIGSTHGGPDGREDVINVAYIDEPGFRGLRVHSFRATGLRDWQPTVWTWPGYPDRDAGGWMTIDVDADGRRDLAHVAYHPVAGLTVDTLLSNGDGTWTPVRHPAWPGFGRADTRSWMPGDVNGDGRADLLHVEHIAAGGVRVHALISNGDGTWNRQGPQVRLPAFRAPDARAWRVADVNGDGRADLVHPRIVGSTARVATLIGHGDGTWADTDATAATSFPELPPSTWRVMDTDGDGRSDLVNLGALPCTSTDENPCEELNDALLIRTIRARGDGDWRDAGSELVAMEGFPRRAVGWHTAEMDGEGASDLVRADYTNPVIRFATLDAALPGGEVATMSNGMGAVTHIRYKGSSSASPNNPGRRCMLPPGVVLTLVDEVVTQVHGTKTYDTERRDYACARWSFRHRAMLGFERTWAHESDAVHQPASTTEKRFAIDDQCMTREADRAVLDAEGRRLARTIVADQPAGAGPPFSCPVIYRDELDYDVSGVARNAYTYFHYDTYGNVTHVWQHGDASRTGDERTIYRGYRPNTTAYIVGLPAFEQVWEGVPPANGPILRTRYFCYDGDNGADWYNCPGQPTRGLLTRVQDVDDKGLYRNTTYLYDAVGNLGVQQNPRHFGRAHFYEQTYRIFPIVTCNALSQCAELEWDPVIAKVTKITDENHQTFRLRYDPLGRLISSRSPTKAVRRVAYLGWGKGGAQRIRETQQDGSADGLRRVTRFDGLGRSYRVALEGDAPGERFVMRTDYADGSPLAHRRSTWFRRSSPRRRYEEFRYDSLGRPVQQRHPGGSSVGWSYGTDGGDVRTTTRNELGLRTSVYSDAYGRPRKVEEQLAVGDTTNTRYAYDAADQLRTITDHYGNVTAFEWDLLGNNTKIVDGDLGTRTYEYDLAGNVSAQTDARSRRITYTHDGLDRLTTKNYPDGTSLAWNYDEPNHGFGRGRLTSVTGGSTAGCPGDRSEDLHYNRLGLVTRQEKCIDGASKLTRWHYDPLGRLDALTFPDGESVPYRYDDAGRLDRAGGYVTDVHYDALGRPKRIAYGNGTHADFTYYADRGGLRRERVRRQNALLYAARYEYLPNGLVETTSSKTNKMNTQYYYDEHGRLLETQGDFARTYRYDELGNMRFNSAVGWYTYPPPSCSPATSPQCRRPHGARFAGPYEFTYDDNGNVSMIQDTATQSALSIDWTLDHRPFVVSDFDDDVTYFGYDAWNELVRRQTAFEDRRFFGPHLESSSPQQLTKRIFLGDLLIAEKDWQGTRWIHGDRLGSTRLVTDAQGGVVSRHDYEPYGLAAGAIARTDRGLRSSRTDPDNGLVEMGARFYSPQFGRFMSPDTVIPNLLDPQTLNRYAYALNSPASYIDPTGHQPEEPDELVVQEIEDTDIDWDLVLQHEMGLDLTRDKAFYWEDGRLVIIDASDKEQVPGTAEVAPDDQPSPPDAATDTTADADLDREMQALIDELPVGVLYPDATVYDPAKPTMTGGRLDTPDDFGVRMFGAFTEFHDLQSKGFAAYGAAAELAAGIAGGVSLGSRAAASMKGAAFRVVPFSQLGTLPKAAQGTTTIVLGHFKRPWPGGGVFNTLEGVLEPTAQQLGGKTLAEVSEATIEAMIPHIDKADRIVFFWNAAMSRLTLQEFRYITSNPQLLEKTTFIVGAFK